MHDSQGVVIASPDSCWACHIAWGEEAGGAAGRSQVEPVVNDDLAATS